jgi:hypothetical protein
MNPKRRAQFLGEELSGPSLGCGKNIGGWQNAYMPLVGARNQRTGLPFVYGLRPDLLNLIFG